MDAKCHLSWISLRAADLCGGEGSPEAPETLQWKPEELRQEGVEAQAQAGRNSSQLTYFPLYMSDWAALRDEGVIGYKNGDHRAGQSE